jgi:diguanylate cyclase (GGDEF)-like protein
MSAGLDDETLARIWGQHSDAMYARVDTIAAALVDGSKRPAARDAAHQLAGTVGTFGFPRASELARTLEQMLVDAADDRATMGRLVGELRAELDDPPFIATTTADPAADAPPTLAPLPRVLLVTEDDVGAERLRTEAGRRGMAVDAAPVEEMLGRAERDRPDVVVLDIGGSAEAVGALAERGVAVVVLADAPELAERLEIARGGAAACVDRGSTPAEVMDQVALAIQTRAEVGERVLLVGTDEADALVAEGFEVEVAGDDVWAELERVSPALIVLAEDHDLCRVLRNAPRWAVVPVIMVSDDPAEAFAAGADDCVPAESDELAARVRGHLERFRAHQAHGETDALTGLQNRRTASAAISGLIRMAERLGKTLCLAQVDVDQISRVNELHGRSAGDAVLRRLGDTLRRTFRNEDVIARWGGEELVLGLFSLDREGGIQRISDVLRRFRDEEFAGEDGPFTVTFSAGVAEYPTDGADLEALSRAADEALYAAKTAGRDQVAGAGGSQSSQQVDVAIVEDEDAASELMSHMLTQRGHRCWRFSNGAGAATLLGGSEPKVRARVVLLDLNMPAVNGMELLGMLQRDDVLRTTRVIVVTASDDPETRTRTRALGAVDYLVKPVEPAALTHAVDRALGRS